MHTIVGCDALLSTLHQQFFIKQLSKTKPYVRSGRKSNRIHFEQRSSLGQNTLAHQISSEYLKNCSLYDEYRKQDGRTNLK